MARKKIAQSLEEKRVLIFNSSKPEIAPLLADMGADEAFVKSGKDQYNEVISLSTNQKKEKQEEDLAYDNYLELKDDSKLVAKKNFRLIKMASRADKNLQDRIKIGATKEIGVEEWIQQTIEFYNLVLNESVFLPKLSRFKITPESLAANIQQLEDVKSLRNQAISEKGEAQEATRLRNVKMEELEDYCYELKTIATIALADKPQLLEMLGILVR